MNDSLRIFKNNDTVSLGEQNSVKALGSLGRMRNFHGTLIHVRPKGKME